MVVGRKREISNKGRWKEREREKKTRFITACAVVPRFLSFTLCAPHSSRATYRRSEREPAIRLCVSTKNRHQLIVAHSSFSFWLRSYFVSGILLCGESGCLCCSLLPSAWCAKSRIPQQASMRTLDSMVEVFFELKTKTKKKTQLMSKLEKKITHSVSNIFFFLWKLLENLFITSKI